MEVKQSALTISSWPKAILKGTLGLSSQQPLRSCLDEESTGNCNSNSLHSHLPMGDLADAVQVRRCLRFADSLSNVRDVFDDHKLAEWFRGRVAAIRRQIGELTLRERQVMFLIAHGRSNKETAVVLSISVKTVEKYRSSVCKKLDVKTSAELAHLITAADLHDGPLSEPEG